MPSSMTSHGGIKVDPLYSFLYEITTFFMITKKRAKISSLNFLGICIMRLWPTLCKYIFMTSLMASSGHKVSQILKFIYLRQYLIYSVDQKLKMSELFVAIFLVYSASGNTSGKKVCQAQNGGNFENFEILNTASIWPQILKDRPKLCQKKFFLWWWRHRWHHRVASKFLSIFMFRSGWLREQIARVMSRQQLPIS